MNICKLSSSVYLEELRLTNRQKEILIIVPAYNEEASIKKTLGSLLELRDDITQFKIDICVINDGSKDKTAQIVEDFDVILINLPHNLGIGSAMQTGYKYAYKNNYDIAIQFDADGQHNKDDIVNLIEPLINGECDLAVGSRYVNKTDYTSTVYRRLGMIILSMNLMFVTGKKFTDPTSGFRAKNEKVIKQFALDYPKDYPEPEVLIQLVKRGYLIKDVKVHMSQREGGQSSITPLKSIYYMIKVSMSIFMQKLMKE